MKYDVFISYRREGGDTLAQLLYDRLTQRGYRVFLDIESLNSGKFNEKLLDVIEECKDIIVVLPPNALSRCHNEGDWLYREIQHSIKHSKNIIPILMKNFFWPDDIPEEISEIKNYNGIQDNKDYFDAVIDKITSLLKSKPVIGGNLTIKFQSRKNTFKNTIKRRKKIIVSLSILCFLCIGLLSYFQYRKIQEKYESESCVFIELTPSEEMSASEYYNAIDILKERIDVFADGYNYSFKEDKDKITLSLPLEVFHDIEPLNITKSTITRPGELYLAPSTYSGDDSFFHIERSSIENIELVSEVPVEFDLTNYNMNGSEEYQYFALTLDAETADTIKKWMTETDTSDYHIFFDYEDFGYNNSFYALMKMDVENNILYFVGNCQYENMLNTSLYSLSHDTFSQAFNIQMKLPVKWEDTNNANYILGENQCNESDLSGPLIRLDFQSYSDNLTEGEYQDIIIAFKTRLDTLDTPYAFGYYTSDSHTISIKINPSLLNDQIINLLGSRNINFNITSNFYEIVSNYNVSNAQSIDIIKTSSESYALQITPYSYWYQVLSENDWFSNPDDSSSIYLCYNSEPLCENTFGESYNGEIFIFDSMNYWGLDSIDEEHTYLLELIKTTISGPDMPYEYYFKNSYYENVDETEDFSTLFPLKEHVSDNVSSTFETIISELSCISNYNISVSNTGQTVSIVLELPVTDTFTENISQVIQELYTKGAIESGNSRNIYIYFVNSLNDSADYFHTTFNVSYFSHNVETSFFRTSLSEEKTERLESELNTNPFYQELNIYSYNLDENGKIILK